MSRLVATTTITALLALVSGCGGSESSTDRTQPPAAASNEASTDASAGTSRAPDRPTRTAEAPEEEPMQISITIGDQKFTATLAQSAAASDLLAQLPVTVEMVDHGGVEKTGPLPEPLSLDGQPEGADPAVGDLGYYAPGEDLVLYDGNQSYFPGIVVLGRLDGDAGRRIAELDGAVTATVDVR